MSDMEAYLTTIVPGQTPCLSCLYPEKPDWDKRGFGVLGAVSGAVACLAALEAIKVLTGLGRPLRSRLLTMDLGSSVFSTLRLFRDPSCQVCGEGAVVMKKEETFYGDSDRTGRISPARFFAQ